MPDKKTDNLDRPVETPHSASMAIILGDLLPGEDSRTISKQLLESEEYNKFIVLWGTESCRYKGGLLLHDLFTGFYLHLAAGYCENQEDKTRLLTSAIKYYEHFQTLPTKIGDIHYFVQWQIGLVYEMLGFSWTEVEAALLKASNHHSGRGEAMKYVIQHYRSTGEWGLGYIYSSIAKDRFHGNHPSGCVWFVNQDFYHWKAQYYHSTLCSKIGNISEMEASLIKVLDYAEKHQDEFTQKQMIYFQSFRKAN